MPDGKELPGLGGGGGGTNAITAKAKGKTFKNRIKDVGKILTFPLHKKRVDPTEKFATEGAMAIPAVVGGISKAIPAIAAGVGAVGTMMQAKRKYRTRLNPGKRNSGRVLSPAEKKIFDKSQKDTDQKVNDQKPRDKVVKKILDRKYKKQKERMKTPNRIQSDRRRLLRGMAKGEVMLDQFSPTNNVGGGQIAGTVEAGDDPPVKKKRPPIMARGKLPGARTRFKAGADFLANIKKNK